MLHPTWRTIMELAPPLIDTEVEIDVPTYIHYHLQFIQSLIAGQVFSFMQYMIIILVVINATSNASHIDGSGTSFNRY